MPSGSGEGETPEERKSREGRESASSRSGGSKGGGSDLPEELRHDRAEFLARLAPWIERGAIGAPTIEKLDEYAVLLYERIPTLALIGKGDRALVYTRHILDSLNPLSEFATPPEEILDIGSGGGLPGLPLALAWPDARVVLLEARERKAAFLERAVRQLGLSRRVRVLCERLEEHAQKCGPVYDALFMRAVADPAALVDEAAPCCRPGARWVYFLGAGIDRAVLAAALGATGRKGEAIRGAFGGSLLVGDV
ncbi:MAG TPA: RsmG family class I SAM-dependent methyltransferase [Candidatus Eisenbacteria bacterium]|nr:RsmG family class I SAM-dependent methyltransferase [Candidatus Eisenbacteria bacterium]